MDALLREIDKEWADSKELGDRLEKERDTEQYKDLMRDANGFKAGFIAKEAMLKNDADAETQPRATGLKRRAEDERIESVLAEFPTRDEIRAKKLKFTDSAADAQASSPIPRPIPQISLSESERREVAKARPQVQSKSMPSKPTPQEPTQVVPNADDFRRRQVLDKHIDRILARARYQRVGWQNIAKAPEIRERLGNATYHLYLEAVLGNCDTIRISIKLDGTRDWIFDNGGRALETKVPWEDVQIYLEDVKILFDQGIGGWNKGAITRWMEEHVENAPKLARFEVCIRYREGFLETKKKSDAGKTIPWQYGQKDKTRMIAQSWWGFENLKKVSFTVQKACETGKSYQWYSIDRDEQKEEWKAWVPEKQIWGK
ncbi:hypothetical protein BLS_007181 [Venturia inaequalis]|uniref:Uncharacterized protein n=1 Tax=Venturia inaequalis TaxID=5025 RepID=A0A8H3UAN8_VENIN|nr:hypothetical protein BLS_007181 [Venturia inaequalis]KAE9972295.1 hypothetical protein EG327_009526 [Venturia inaequalis]KAE9987188.1 hypothetical protein EG328_003657 [Venturia inaequalis]RDI86331.1 hypothetical protein Vi05172_g3809 [Venturia inaequalis]